MAFIPAALPLFHDVPQVTSSHISRAGRSAPLATAGANSAVEFPW
jgi:hypothetical protein